MKKKILNILHILYLIILTFLFVASIYSKIEFKDESIEEYLFYYLNGITSSDVNMLLYAIKNYWLIYTIILIILIMLTHNMISNNYPFRYFVKHRCMTTIVITIILSVIALNNVSAFSYAKNNIVKSNFIEDNYYTVNDIKNNKRNLIVLYVESLETTFFSKEHGGAWDYEIMPELYDLLDDEDSIYFSTDDKLLGFPNLYGTSWTTASVISSSTGLPFKIPFSNINFNQNNILTKVNALGDILKSNGYHNEVISGAATKFGGLYDFFNTHGNYTIIDPDTLYNYGYEINDNTKGAWGFNDDYMFTIAKERILKHVSNNQAFNETLISIDTHPIDGYKASYTLSKFDSQYENVYATESKLIYDFINWIKSQDFYNNTTIVILGDHLCMQTKFIGDYNESDRGRFNLIINSINSTNNTKNRLFTSLDLYPTILSSIGFDVDKLGLGINLFSDKKTLSEEYGLEYLEKELRKKSLFYNDLLED